MAVADARRVSWRAIAACRKRAMSAPPDDDRARAGRCGRTMAG